MLVTDLDRESRVSDSGDDCDGLTLEKFLTNPQLKLTQRSAFGVVTAQELFNVSIQRQSSEDLNVFCVREVVCFSPVGEGVTSGTADFSETA